MQTDVITSEPPAQTSKKPTPRSKKRKMSAAGRKAVAAAARARWAARKASAAAPSPAVVMSAPIQPAALAPIRPSPAVIKLQEQVVELVAQRSEARKRLADAHAVYLLAQGTFQAAEANVKATEQDAQYLLGLIAQLENRQSAPPTALDSLTARPPSMVGVTSEPSQAPQPRAQNFAQGSADDLRREFKGMM